ncbi:unnamed protein product [Allacma fusca]|uniref:G-protein coupled receptors family 1 profile domain-containing protein n=1 Tax=Allacma fusca TaxID=39272 RepID=A0A8J2LIJ3_9HEXA|nr:unnamed protein product [Allacma fusca]
MLILLENIKFLMEAEEMVSVNLIQFRNQEKLERLTELEIRLSVEHSKMSEAIEQDLVEATSIYADNCTVNGTEYGNMTAAGEDIVSYPAVQAMFYVIYTTIFVLGIIGNVLVCFVVMRNKAMQTVTNFFITNLALADILLCALAVPFTPLYTFLEEWIFGQVLCHLVGYAQGVSVYISTLTLMSIAIDRFFVIIYPFKPRMKIMTCFLIITSIWIFALAVTLPYGIFLRYTADPCLGYRYICKEDWSSEDVRKVFSATTAILQFVLPFIIMAFCYVKVSLKLSDRAKAKPGSKNSKREAVERERKRRTNRMLIAMVTIFGGCWLPLNSVNVLNDVYIDAGYWRYSNLLFFFAHSVAMSSTCYNPFLYAWLNENFRKEFKQVLPCFYSSQPSSTRSRRLLSERTCNGNETVQETFLPSTSQMIIGGINTAGPKPPLGNLETIEEQTSNSQSAVAVNYEQVSAKYCSTTDAVEIHIPLNECPSAPLPESSTTTPPPSNSPSKQLLTQLV